jgi:hypothetical protein
MDDKPALPTLEGIVDRCKPHDTGAHRSRFSDIVSVVERCIVEGFGVMPTRFMTWDEMKPMPEYEWRRGASPCVREMCKERLIGGALWHADVFISFAAANISFFVQHPSIDPVRLCDLVLIRDTLMCHYPDHEVTQAAKDAVVYSRKVIFNEPDVD